MRRLIVIVLAMIVVVTAGYGLWLVTGPGPMSFAAGNSVALASYHLADPTGVPTDLSSASLVKRGEYLTHAADCTACHTKPGGKPYAGGLAFNLPFGTIYSSNITADRQTGIGRWTDSQFLRAVHAGIDDEGAHLYPAMPYASYTYLTDADVLAIKAYLFSLAPVNQSNPENRLAFPFNQRWLMGVWNAFFLSNNRFEPDTSRSVQWNRGAYLVEALAHCGECHTPRNLAFALDHRRKFAGALTAGWRAYNITPDEGTGLGAWSDSEIASYISTGHADGHGSAAGPMGEAVDASFRYMEVSDIHAIVDYLRSVPPIRSDLPSKLAPPATTSHRHGVNGDVDVRGKMIFAGACASCHSWTGKSEIWRQATLTGARAVNDPTATNVAQVIINGASHDTPHGQVFMPSFGAAYSNEEIASVANYVTARFGSKGANLTPNDVADLRKQSAQ